MLLLLPLLEGVIDDVVGEAEEDGKNTTDGGRVVGGDVPCGG